MRILITGAAGFLGRNLAIWLAEKPGVIVACLDRNDGATQWEEALRDAELVFHLAGTNRPLDPADFDVGNAGLTKQLCAMLERLGRVTRVVFASSTQATIDNPYGRSKKAAEEALIGYSGRTGAAVYIYRLPNLFGKWSRPDYNSVVATFCHHIARGGSIHVDNPAAPLNLAYVDDVLDAFWRHVLDPRAEGGYCEVPTRYATTVGEVASLVQSFADGRKQAQLERVGSGFVRALYATYISYLPKQEFSYALTTHRDPRGAFSEFVRTRDSGQVSYFTANPGMTRGGHYHHTKTEKFLVVRGVACFRFRNMATGDTHEITVRDSVPEVVESIPGWCHDVTNLSDGELVVMLWSSEVFDRARPDTYNSKI
jgi:UDP-2-acetamido-2,6-beta-L-arabino-hexul-4-ose reductase